MTINKKIITMLVLVMAVGTITAISASVNTWIDYDCTTLDKGMIPICNDINILETKIISLESTSMIYEVTETKTAQPGERFDITVRCNPNDPLLSDYVSFSTTHEGFSGGYGGVMDDNPGNVTMQIQVGWYMNLNNRDNIITNFPVNGTVSILCMSHP